MSANLISNKTLSNSVTPFKSRPELLNVFTSSSDYIVPNWYYSLTAILISGGGGALNSLPNGSGAGYPNGPPGGQGGGGAGAISTIAINARPGDTITASVGAGGARNSLSSGGSTSISINGVLLYTIEGGGAGGNANASGGGVNGSGGGVNGGSGGVPFGSYIGSKGAGNCGASFFLSTGSYATTGTYLSSASFAKAEVNGGIVQGLGSYGSWGTGGTYSIGGGGGGAGQLSWGGGPAGVPGSSPYTGRDGGAGTILLIPTLTGEPVKFYVCGGGGGGANAYPGDPENPGDPVSSSGGAGGSVIDNGTTYYIGGSGGSISADGAGNFTSGTSASNGVINTGSGGGGAPGWSFGAGGQGGSGLVILIGQRSYPFSGKHLT